MKLALTEDGVPMSVLREISLLKQLGKANHPNIVRSVIHQDNIYGIEIDDVKMAIGKVKPSIFYIVGMKKIHPYLTRGIDPAYYLCDLCPITEMCCWPNIQLFFIIIIIIIISSDRYAGYLLKSGWIFISELFCFKTR